MKSSTTENKRSFDNMGQKDAGKFHFISTKDKEEKQECLHTLKHTLKDACDFLSLNEVTGFMFP